LKVLLNLLKSDKSLINNTNCDSVYEAILNFMSTKPMIRSPVINVNLFLQNLYNLQILDLKVSSPGFIEKMKEAKTNGNYINPIVTVLTGHIFSKSNVLRVVNLGINQVLQEKAIELDPELEKKINQEGSKVLEKLLDENDIKRHIKDVSI